ncbi:MAG: hypothetical protein LBS60_00640 [Deltaproteobacteria bacterium]|jgi:hypothetical protein|nr:hypothetical protein [Deltaproteobacteria bacterium]
MTVIEKIVTISEDRRLKLDLESPKDTPTGEVTLSLTVTPLDRSPKPPL